MLNKTIQQIVNNYLALQSTNTATMHNNCNNNIVNIVTDNLQDIQPNTLFIAIQGSNFNALNHLPQIFSQPNVVCAVQKGALPNSTLQQHKFIEVDDVRKFLASSVYYCHNHSLPKNIVAVTGTNGKTSVSFFIQQFLQLLQQSNVLIGTTGAYINGNKVAQTITTPKPTSLINVFNNANGVLNYCSLEASSHALHQHRLYSLPFVSVGFTNLTQDHLDYHSCMQNYFATKQSLFTQYKSKYACINTDDEYGKILAQNYTNTLLDYGYNANYCKIVNITNNAHSQTVTVLINNKTSHTFTINILGDFMVYNVLCAMLMLVGCGFSFANLCNLSSSLSNVNGRLNLIKVNLPNNATASIFIDYAHTPNALQSVLNTLNKIPNSNIVTIFGCGGNRDQGKRKLMGEIASRLSNQIIITNDNPRDEDEQAIARQIMQGVVNQQNCTIITNRYKAIEHAIANIKPNQIILIAGKGHEDTQIIGKTILPFNDTKVACQILTNLGLPHNA